VVEKLKQLGMFPIAIDTIVGKLIEDNYLNETRFAKSFARGKFRIKGWGKLRITRELKIRQISEYNIKLGLKEITESEYNTVFWSLFEKQKKATQGDSIPSRKRKILHFFIYRGWETHKVYEALNLLEE
jgi:regulatory protein